MTDPADASTSEHDDRTSMDPTRDRDTDTEPTLTLRATTTTRHRLTPTVVCLRTQSGLLPRRLPVLFFPLGRCWCSGSTHIRQSFRIMLSSRGSMTPTISGTGWSNCSSRRPVRQTCASSPRPAVKRLMAFAQQHTRLTGGSPNSRARGLSRRGSRWPARSRLVCCYSGLAIA